MCYSNVTLIPNAPMRWREADHTLKGQNRPMAVSAIAKRCHAICFQNKDIGGIEGQDSVLIRPFVERARRSEVPVSCATNVEN